MEYQRYKIIKTHILLERWSKIKGNKCVICHGEKDNTYDKFCNDCSNDKEKLKKYYENLEKRRKYTKGESIHSFDELLEQKFVYVNGKIYHIGWVKSWQIQMADCYLKRNLVYKAIKKSPLNSVDIDVID